MTAVAGLLPLLLVQAPDIIKIQARIWTIEDRLSITTRKITNIRSVIIAEGSKPIDNEDARESNGRVMSAPTLMTIGGQEVTMMMALSVGRNDQKVNRVTLKLVPVVTSEGTIIVSLKHNVKDPSSSDPYEPAWPSVLADLTYRSGESGFIMVPFPENPDRRLLIEMKVIRNPEPKR